VILARLCRVLLRSSIKRLQNCLGSPHDMSESSPTSALHPPHLPPREAPHSSERRFSWVPPVAKELFSCEIHASISPSARTYLEPVTIVRTLAPRPSPDHLDPLVIRGPVSGFSESLPALRSAAPLSPSIRLGLPFLVPFPPNKKSCAFSSSD